MKRAWAGKILGLGVAAGLSLVAEAGAYNWCPSANDNTIACWNCTVTLTCNYDNVISITGNNVTLDGNGKTLSYSPVHGVAVYGYGSIIKNLTIWTPAFSGITYFNTQGSSLVDNVYEYGGVYGIVTETAQHLSVMNSVFTENSMMGVWSLKPAGMTHWTDISNTHLDYNDQRGLHSERGYYQVHTGNTYSGNGTIGAFARYSQRDTYNNSTMNNNLQDGIFLSTNVGDVERVFILNSSGHGNAMEDCYAWTGTRMTVSNSSFGSHVRCVTTP